MTDSTLMPVHVQRDRFDPVPELAELREERPVSRVRLPSGVEAWLVTRYSDVREVFGDATRFSNSGAENPLGRTDPDAAANGKRQESGFLLGYDPPDHNRLRRLLTGEFTVRRIQRMQPRIDAIVTEHLDAMEAAGSPADLVRDFALPVPSLVICELLGVPYEHRADFQDRSRIRLDMTQDMPVRMAAVEESRAYMAALIAGQREHPGDDMIGMLIREHGDEVSDEELTGVADLLLLAGHETTSNMLGLGTLLLLRNPDQLALVRDGDAAAVDTAVEELLRHLSVVHTVMPRTARVDLELGGVSIAAGETVVLSVPSANRDPELGDDLERLDVTRRIASHLAFGHGIHHCLGAPLARMEMRTAYPALLRRFPGLRLSVPFADVPFRAFSVVYGVTALPVAW